MPSGFKAMLKLIFDRFCVLILSILILFSSPLILLASTPLLLIRWIVQKFARYFCPDLRQMLTSRANFFTNDDVHNKPKCNVIIALTLKGNVDIEKGQETIRKNIIEIKLPNGNLKYPELKQCLTSWLGYYFWKDCSNFDLKNHVKILTKKDRHTDQDLQLIRQEFIENNWVENRPLWEMIFIPNCYPKGLEESGGPYTIFVSRFHHTMGDGYAWQSILFHACCNKPIDRKVPECFKTSKWTDVLYIITFPFRAAYNSAEMMITTTKEYPLKVSKKGGSLHTCLSNIVPIGRLKEIKNHYGATLSTVITAVLAGTVREILMKKGIQVPNTFPTVLPFPIAGHSLKLRNYLTGGIIHLPTGEPDPIARLKYCHKDYMKLKHSTTPVLMKYTFKMLGSYCSWLVRLLQSKWVYSVTLSNFPGGFQYVSFNGHDLQEVMFCTGLPDATVGLGFCIVSYMDYFRFAAVANGGVMTKNQVDEIPGIIEEQINVLYKNAINDV